MNPEALTREERYAELAAAGVRTRTGATYRAGIEDLPGNPGTALTDHQIFRCSIIARDRIQIASILISYGNRVDAYRWLEAAETAVVAARTGLGEAPA